MHDSSASRCPSSTPYLPLFWCPRKWIKLSNGTNDEDYLPICDGNARTTCIGGEVADVDCLDDDVCNGEETCLDGSCVSGTPLLLDDGNACTTDVCDPVNGVSHPAALTGTSCSDGNACNGAETCFGCSGVPEGAVAWWPAEGNANDTIGGYSGNALGTSFVAGYVGQVFSFSTLGRVDLSAHAGALNFSGSATLEGWIRVTSDTCRTIFSVGSGTNATQYLRTGNGCSTTLTDELITWNYANGSTTSEVGVTTSDRALLIGTTYHHLAITFDTTDTRIYIDGVEQPVTIATGTDHGDWGGLVDPVGAYIGARFSGGTLLQPLGSGGRVDELTLYDRALSITEIEAIHFAGAEGKCLDPNPVCEAGTPPTLDDGSVCTIDSCDPVTGVQHVPVDIDDENVCTSDSCHAVTGVSHVPVDPSDGNACTVDTCDPASGFHHEPQDPSDGDACTSDACDPVLGFMYTPLPEDADCAPIDRCADGIDNDDDALVDCDDSDCAGEAPCEVCGNSLDDDGDALFDCADLDCDEVPACDHPPADPEQVAPILDLSTPTTFADSLGFLYEGPDPIQRGVLPGTFEEKRISVIRGRVIDVNETPLARVRVSVPRYPDYGVTYTRTDGRFDLVVNAGEQLTIAMSHDGYLGVQRKFPTNWQEPVELDDVVMTVVSATATVVDLTGTEEAQVVQGPIETDVDGSRRGVLLFPSGTRAEVTLHDGTTVPMESVDELSVRVTEYTVGSLGGRAMPAELPPNSAFTYAVELSADGAKHVHFTSSLPYYVDNFLGFRVGTEIPLGYYDPDKGQWIASDSGVVIKIVGTSPAGAEIDIDGDAVPEDSIALAAWGITGEERLALGATYPVGAELWRLMVDHFSAWDANMGVYPPADAEPPDGETDGPLVATGPAPECTADGSIVECQSQALGESIALPGTPYSLNYRSDRSPHSNRSITVKLGSSERLASAPFLYATVVFQPKYGERFSRSWLREFIPPDYTWEWNGVDAYGRPVQGENPVDITITYTYECQYGYVPRFGYNGNGIPIEIEPNPRRTIGDTETIERLTVSVSAGVTDTNLPCAFLLKQKLKRKVDAFDFRKVGIGGWSISEQHLYDREAQLLLMGDGRSVAASELPPVIGTASSSPGGQEFAPVVANASDGGMAVDSDGTLYAIGSGADFQGIARLENGQFEPYLGAAANVSPPDPVFFPCFRPEDNGKDVGEVSIIPNHLAFAPNGDLYVAVCGQQIVRIDREDKVHLIAGNGLFNYLAKTTGVPTGEAYADLVNWEEGGNALDESPFIKRIAIGPDGKVYAISSVTDLLSPGPFGALETRPAILMVDTDGRISTITGGLSATINSRQNSPAISFPVPASNVLFYERFNAIAVGQDGALYFTGSAFGVEHNGSAIPEGEMLYTVDVAGNLRIVFGGHWPNVPVLSNEQLEIAEPTAFLYQRTLLGIEFDSHGLLNILDRDRRVLLMDPRGGKVFRLAGPASSNALDPLSPNGTPARDATISSGWDFQPGVLAVGPDGTRYVSRVLLENGNTTGWEIVKISSPTGTELVQEVLVPSPDGAELFVFDPSGRHLRTLDAQTNSILQTFAYDASGAPEAITNAYGQITSVERDINGNLSAIVAPHGQRTELVENPDGYLAEIGPDPDAPPYELYYDGDGGLLETLIDPRGGAHGFQYQDRRLVSDSSPDGRELSLQRQQTGALRTVTQTETDAGSTTYVTDFATRGVIRSEVHFPDGTTNVALQTANANTTMTYANGTVTTTAQVPDPASGILASLPSTTTTLPSGLTTSIAVSVSSTLSDPSEPYSWLTRTTARSISGNQWTEVYDRAARTSTTMSPQGRVTTVTYDEFSKPVLVQRPGRAPVEIDYNDIGRLASIHQGAGANARSLLNIYSETTGYLASSTQVELDETTSYVHDDIGRVLNTVRPDGAVTVFGYDAAGNVTSLTPPERPTHLLSYTPADLQQNYTAPAASSGQSPAVKARQYTGHRRVRTLSRADGSSATFTYGLDGKLDAITSALGTSDYSYNPATGQLAAISGPGSTALAFTYDGSLPTSTTWSGAVQGSVSRSYDNHFWLDQLLVNGTQVVDYGHDLDGLIITASSLSVTRDPASGDITQTVLGSNSTIEQTNGFGELDGYIAERAGVELFSEQVTQRDARGRIVQRVETVQGASRTYGYFYDHAGRLTDVVIDGAQAVHYQYDANGNRLARATFTTTEAGSYDDQDRMTAYGDLTFVYNDAGDLLTKTDTSNSATTAFDHDVFGNLRSVQLPDGRLVEYEIDAVNRRIGKKIDGVKQYGLLYQDQLEPVAMLDASNAVVATFVYATRRHVPDYMVKNGVTYRLVVDHLGSVRMVVNTANGNVEQEILYDEFGNVLGDSSPGFQPFGFAGGIYDADTSLVRFGARDYDAATGRWTAKDPLLFRGGQTNLYAYVNSDPINRIDPTGLVGTGVAEATIGGTLVCGPICGGVALVLSAALVAGIIISCSEDGTPGNNREQNKQFNDAVREIQKVIGRALTADEIRQLHDWIQDMNAGFWDIVEEGVGLFGG